MNTIEKLDNYKRALEKWVSKKRRYELLAQDKSKNIKPLESEPKPLSFEITGVDMEWAERIRRQVTKPKPVMPTLDEQLPKIKMPERKKI